MVTEVEWVLGVDHHNVASCSRQEMIFERDPLTIHAAIQGWGDQAGDAPAIAAPGRKTLTYGGLMVQMKRVLSMLNGEGIGLGDRVALALPQGPELAVTCLSVASGATAVLLNPDGREEDFELFFREIQPKVLILQKGVESPARGAAFKQGISVLELVPASDGAAGEFVFAGDVETKDGKVVLAGPDDIALLLRTSGTTSRPKTVPLMHRNVCAAADNTLKSIGICPEDRCLDVATLFHAHGLVAGVVASVMGGASVMCPPAFDAVSFFSWLDELRPTWFTAVPTVHEAILREAPQHQDVISRQRLRFIRSASAFLPDAVRTELEEVFDTVVTESYGLSEAMQLTNTPLDRKTRKIGSLGVPGTSEIGIMDVTGRLLGPGESGEIVARGPVVMGGYLNLTDTDSSVFLDGWLRTGDVGYLDSDGHLYMTGRLKDQINRGGEKISPQEIDKVLLEHPAVCQAMAFGMAHPSLGEEVGAAVVLRTGFEAVAEEIRKHAASRLEDFKVPRKIFIVPTLPSNSTGKFLRRDLAAKLEELKERPPYAAPSGRLEEELVRIWEEVLGHSPIGINDDFFDLGGHSLLAIALFARISKELGDDLRVLRAGGDDRGKTLRPSLLWEAATIRQLARCLMANRALDSLDRPLVEVQRGGARVPFVMLTGDWYGMGFYIRRLAKRLDPAQPVYAFMPHDVTVAGSPRTIEAMAEDFLATLKVSQPKGPYLLGGYSHAGLVAFEMAKRLEAMGECVPLLLVIDSLMPDPRLRYLRKITRALARVVGWSGEREFQVYRDWRFRVMHARELRVKGFSTLVLHYLHRLRRKRIPEPSLQLSAENAQMLGYFAAIDEYFPTGRISSRVTVVSTLEGIALRMGDPGLGWSKAAANVRVLRIPGDHFGWVREHVDCVAEHLRACLEASQKLR